jgi:hypothetical protein
VHHVAHDPDVRVVERAQALAQRVDVEQGLRRVLVLAVAGVDDRSGGPPSRRAPPPRRAGVRTTIRSGRYAERVWTVSLSDSPFSTLDPDETKLMTSADKVLAASSKEDRVRVDAS